MGGWEICISAVGQIQSKAAKQSQEEAFKQLA